MKFKLDIDCDTPAFKAKPATEIARILRNAADRIEHSGEGAFEEARIFDAKGIRVGEFGCYD